MYPPAETVDTKFGGVSIHRCDRKVVNNDAHRRKLHRLSRSRKRICRAPANLLRAVRRRSLQQFTIEVLRVLPQHLCIERYGR